MNKVEPDLSNYFSRSVEHFLLFFATQMSKGRAVVLTWSQKDLKTNLNIPTQEDCRLLKFGDLCWRNLAFCKNIRQQIQ